MRGQFRLLTYQAEVFPAFFSQCYFAQGRPEFLTIFFTAQRFRSTLPNFEVAVAHSADVKVVILVSPRCFR